MNEILQGTTPTIKAKVPSVININDIVGLELTIKNENMTTIKKLSDVQKDTEENAFSYHFSEDETLALRENSTLIIQYRFKLFGGDIVGTKQYKVPVANLISEAKI